VRKGRQITKGQECLRNQPQSWCKQNTLTSKIEESKSTGQGERKADVGETANISGSKRGHLKGRVRRRGTGDCAPRDRLGKRER